MKKYDIDKKRKILLANFALGVRHAPVDSWLQFQQISKRVKIVLSLLRIALDHWIFPANTKLPYDFIQLCKQRSGYRPNHRQKSLPDQFNVTRVFLNGDELLRIANFSLKSLDLALLFASIQREVRCDGMPLLFFHRRFNSSSRLISDNYILGNTLFHYTSYYTSHFLFFFYLNRCCFYGLLAYKTKHAFAEFALLLCITLATLASFLPPVIERFLMMIACWE